MTARADRVGLRLLGLLIAVDADQVVRDPDDYEYRRTGSPRIISAAVYSAELRGLVRLDHDGRATTTEAGARHVEALDDELYARPSPPPRRPAPPPVQPVPDPPHVIAARRAVLVDALAGGLPRFGHYTFPATRHGLPLVTERTP